MSRPRLRQWRIKPGLSCRSFVPTVDCKPRLDDMKFLETRRFREGWREAGYRPKLDNDSDFLEWKFDHRNKMGAYQTGSTESIMRYTSVQ